MPELLSGVIKTLPEKWSVNSFIIKKTEIITIRRLEIRILL